MSKVIAPALFALLLNNVLAGQITHVGPATVPRTIIPPYSLTARVQLSDSLKAKGYSAAQVMKLFFPQYTDSFQRALKQDLYTMYEVGYNIKDLAEALRTEYPGMTLSIASKLLYSTLFGNTHRRTGSDWPWKIQDTISTAFNSSNKFTHKLLKDATVDIQRIFTYYMGYYYQVENPSSTPYRIDYHLSEYIRAGYTADDVYELIILTYTPHQMPARREFWQNKYCEAMKLARVSADNVGRVLYLRSGLTKTQISSMLSNAGYTAAEVLSALQAM